MDTQGQFLRLEGFGQIIIGAEAQALDAILGIAAGGQQDDRRFGMFADRAGQFKPVHTRHHHIEDQKVETQRIERRKRLGRIGRRRNAKAAPLQEALQQGADPVVIIDHQDVGFVASTLGHAISQS